MQCFIEEQLRKIDKGLDKQSALETYMVNAQERLSISRASTRVSRVDEAGAAGPISALETTGEEEEEAYLNREIETIRQEKSVILRCFAGRFLVAVDNLFRGIIFFICVSVHVHTWQQI